jgi:hypothetical protein
MTRTSTLVIMFWALTWSVLAVTEVRAAVTTHGSIGILLDSVGTGSVTCSGQYKVDDGWTVTGVTLYAVPADGGLQSSHASGYGSGKWGDATISGLITGTKYNVWPQMTIQDTDGNTQTISGAQIQMTPK